MREFELIIDEALKRGLSPEYTLPTNSQFLWQALGFRCGRAGLEPAAEGINPLPPVLDLHYSWPFPQYLVGEKYNFLIIRDSVLGRDEVYSIGDNHIAITHVYTIDVATYGTGWLMDAADFGEYAFMTNGVCMLYWNTSGTWGFTTGTDLIPLLGTVCNLKGQMIGGNVRSSWYDCDETYYVWSRIGHADFTPMIENDAGYRRCPYGGEVYHVRRLGDQVLGYSSKGICLLFPASDPAPTLGCKELLSIGLVNRGAVNGSLDKQVFIGTDLVVREITKEGIKELGYKHWMEQLDGEDIIITYDNKKGDFYIGNSFRTYLLSSYGMTEVLQHPSAVWRKGSTQLYMIPDTVEGISPAITTEVFDMGYKGQKTISIIETDAFPVVNPYAAVDCAYNLSSWNSSMFTPINDMGIATVPVSGNLFRFKVRFDSIDESFRIGYLKARYKMTDLRGIRGVYAPPLRGQVSAD